MKLLRLLNLKTHLWGINYMGVTRMYANVSEGYAEEVEDEGGEHGCKEAVYGEPER